MKRADIKLGFSCNNNCKHCVVADKRDKFKDRTTAEVKLEIKKAKENNCSEIVLTGGEPTIRKDVVEIITYTKELNFKNIQLQTNGRMLSYKLFTKRLIEAGLTEIVVALHGHIPPLHDYLTSTEGSFEQTVKGIINLRELSQDIRIAINIVVSKPNYRYLEEIVKLIVKLNVNQYQFAFVHPLGNAKANFYSIVPRLHLIEPYIKKGLDLGSEAGISAMTEAIPYCFMQGYEKYIAENYIPDTMIFDIDSFTEDFKEVRINEGKLKNNNCKKCYFYKICEGPWREYPEGYGWAEFQPIII